MCFEPVGDAAWRLVKRMDRSVAEAAMRGTVNTLSREGETDGFTGGTEATDALTSIAMLMVEELRETVGEQGGPPPPALCGGQAAAILVFVFEGRHDARRESRRVATAMPPLYVGAVVPGEESGSTDEVILISRA